MFPTWGCGRTRPSVAKEAFKPKWVKGDARPERVPRRLRRIRLRRRSVRDRREIDLGWLVIVAAGVVSVVAWLHLFG